MSRSGIEHAVRKTMETHNCEAPNSADLGDWLDHMERRERSRRWMRPTLAAAAVAALAVGVSMAAFTATRGTDLSNFTQTGVLSVAEQTTVPSASLRSVQVALPDAMSPLPGALCGKAYNPSLNDEQSGISIDKSNVARLDENLYSYSVDVINNTSKKQYLLVQPWILRAGTIVGKALPGQTLYQVPRKYTVVEPGDHVQLTGKLGLYSCDDVQDNTPENGLDNVSDPLAGGDYEVFIAVGNDVPQGGNQTRSPVAVAGPIIVKK